jgi:RNA polymerase sigma factor (sigma-70 family)
LNHSPTARVHTSRPVHRPRRRSNPFTAEDDRQLTSAALEAMRGGSDERNALYAALAPALTRKATTIWHRRGRQLGIDPDDLLQESFLIYVDLLERWSGQGSFTAYLLGSFWWRMHASVNRLVGPAWSRASASASPSLIDESYAAEQAMILLDQVTACLDPRDRQIVLWRVCNGLTVHAIADRLGVDRRTVSRCWKHAIAEVRAQMDE